MKNFKTEIRKLTVSEYQTLRNSTSWPVIENDTVEKALHNDLFTICVLDDKKIIGMGRLIGDGAIYFYIQDVIVLPEYQNMNVGNSIMAEIEKYLSENAPKNAFIGLMAASGVEEFYTRFNYLKRPEDRPGMYKIIS